MTASILLISVAFFIAIFLFLWNEGHFRIDRIYAPRHYCSHCNVKCGFVDSENMGPNGMSMEYFICPKCDRLYNKAGVESSYNLLT